ncbi:MAG: recombination-associated protein RdgC [Gammaproteobacteria bacterium]|nr:recombination-associated protein RdgC [Gammaproteobacteria bacterium]
MKFRQIQLFQLNERISFSPTELANQLTQFAFEPCLPSMSTSVGWVSPHTDEEDAPLFRAINDRVMLCLQIEEKILPAGVIRQHLYEKIRKLEIAEARKIRLKEKNSLKDEIIMTLLPRAFSRLHRIYCYIDLRKQWLVVGSTHSKHTEQLIHLFQKSLAKNVASVKIEGLPSRMTHWLKSQDYPAILAIEKSCLLQDPDQQARTIRCQQQDLNAEAIQALLKTGCQLKQLRLSWQDQVHFTLSDPFMLQGVQFQEEVITRLREMDPETAEQQFDADFFITSELMTQLLAELLSICEVKEDLNAVA